MASADVHYCDLCGTGEGKTTAEYFCHHDKQYYCPHHYNEHQMFSSNQEHTVNRIIGHGFGLGVKGGGDGNEQFFCEHESAQCMYCKDHKILFCLECKKRNHDTCEYRFDIEKDLRGTDSLIARCENCLRDMKSMKASMKEQCVTTQEKQQTWVTEIKCALESVNAFKVELEEKISKKVDYVQQIMNKKKEDSHEKVRALQAAIDAVEQKMARLKAGRDGVSRQERYRGVVEMEEKLADCQKILATAVGDCRIEFLKAEHEFEAKNYVEGTLFNFREAVETLNNIYSEIQDYFMPVRGEQEASVTLRPQYYTKRDKASRNQMAKSEPLSTCHETQAKEIEVSRKNRSASECYESKFSKSYLEEYQPLMSKDEKESYPCIPIQSHCNLLVRLPGENTKKPPCITGIAPVANGYYIMADFENSSLKLFVICGRIEDEMKFETTPRDIAKVDENMVLVNFPMAKNIQYVSIETDNSTGKKYLKIVKEKIPTNVKCCGIAFHDDKIYVATQLPHQILILTRDGQPLNTIVGKGLFERATYIAVDPDTSVIYVSDPSNKCVIGINEQSEIKFKYPVELPHGIACAGEGMLFVGDWETGVHLVDRHGSRYQDLKLGQCPQKLCFDTHKQMLLLTEWSSEVVWTIYLKRDQGTC